MAVALREEITSVEQRHPRREGWLSILQELFKKVHHGLEIKEPIQSKAAQKLPDLTHNETLKLFDLFEYDLVTEDLTYGVWEARVISICKRVYIMRDSLGYATDRLQGQLRLKNAPMFKNWAAKVRGQSNATMEQPFEV
ncbi:uncharacterized protein IUM83_02019 [Phytophthora cinnamomi]|uniref:uncharacterized protein n=1 Tax=Phytophthora cinnamomi TaxID=4785 RepID=UPI0035596E89|nr:hypothetical protein IUM83_02019 [Phytophthora cinnamomi]